MDSPLGSKASEPSLPPVAGVKRPAPSLLPAFEPLSSSPGLPRLIKKPRNNASGLHSQNAYAKYPTPVPTSSTGIMSSSPPARVLGGRPALQRTLSTASERNPLCAVPSIELNENGETLLMGRSSNSSHYQLSANRLISRVHAKARYIPAMGPLEPNKVEIVCCGWNGLKLHCQGRTWDLSKGDTFTSETENAELMMDVQDARVRIQWPKKTGADSLANLSDSSWDSPRSARRHNNNGLGGNTPGAPGGSALQSSPLRRAARIASPESPTPAGMPISGASLQALLSQHMGSDDEDDDSGPAIQIYEDANSEDEPELPKQDGHAGVSFATELAESFSSDLSDIHSDDDANDSSQNDDVDDPDEENDPIVHSFGPFGANLSDRLASFSTNSPKVGRPPLSRIPSADGSITSFGSAEAAGEGDSIHVKRSAPPLRPSTPTASGTPLADPNRSAEGVGLGISVEPKSPAPEQKPVQVEISSNVNVEEVRNHLINQLAFSRLSSSPLSTIMNNLPAEERRDLTTDALRYIIENTPCVGVIKRQGKDAAGKALESEYYYVSDMDDDVSRRSVVDNLRKPSLRNCRKQHKQYYWKRPRTP
ncbi:target of SBF [Sporothrix stenoceras]|uniref:Target of SBF n=1 Tax=Sporothrix stenoceras TaxID=5173 RepID=A0ABR3YYA3_9PEZI